MASVSSTSSLGNTSLRGFGGMVSGIDRDEIIEQMTLGTTTKITNAKGDITKLQWKQEAYRSLSDKIIGLSDNYGSFTSPSSLVDPTLFAKSIITTHGSDKSKNYVTATGTSDLLDNVSISAVRQLATSTVQQSETRNGTLKTTLNDLDQTKFESSNLMNTSLDFGLFNSTTTEWTDKYSFVFPPSYTKTNADGTTETVDISDYYYASTPAEFKELATKLNEALKYSNAKVNNEEISKVIEFSYDETTGKMGINEIGNGMGEYRISLTSTALKGLGYDTSKGGSVIKLEDYNNNLSNIADHAVTRRDAIDGLTNATVTFNYNGSQKNVTMLTQAEADKIRAIKKDSEGLSQETKDKLSALDKETDRDKLKEMATKLGINLEALNKKLHGSDAAETALTEDEIKSAITDKYLAPEKMKILQEGLQSRLNQAFGTDNVIAELGNDGTLQFRTNDATSSVSISGGSGSTLWNLGVGAGASTKVNLKGTLSQDVLGIDLADEKYKDGLVINGVKIDGITKDTSISDILSKINNSKAGVKATYVDATGQFMLVSSETGKGREINLESTLAQELFGGDPKNGAKKTDGQDAIIDVSYGNGVTVSMNRASNTFNLEGLSVTVSGVFGGEWKETVPETDKDGNEIKDENGNTVMKKEWVGNTADTVTFTAKADVDKVTERVKSFIEAFNELATEVNTQLTSRPDKSYGPLTEEQKAEMDETSIENWENKAKQGLLYSDTIIRDLSGDIQSVMVKLMNSGVNYQDLEKIGITYSEDYKDGGKLIFDETKFRAAMESDPQLASDIFTGGGSVSKGLTKIVEDTLTPYATRYASRNPNGMGGSYGRLVEEAGSEKAPSTLSNNFIYKQIEEMNKRITELQSKLKTQQDRYIKQFSSMESLISQMNSQSSWLSQITG